MSLIARESEIDVEDIKARMHPAAAQEALGYIEQAMQCLKPLHDEADGTANEVYRALSIAHMGLVEALDD